MRVDGIQHDPMLPTGRVEVTVDKQGVPEYDILEDRAWDRIGFTPALSRILDEEIALVCFGSLAQRSPRSCETIGKVLDRLGPRTVKVCDLNLRQNYYSAGLIEDCLQRADIVKLNEDELEIALQFFGKGESGGGDEEAADLVEEFDLKCLFVTRGSEGSELHLPGGETLKGESGGGDEEAADLVEEFDLKCLFVTRGSEGSELHLPGGETLRRTAITDRLAGGRLVDTVGAGDAYTAMLCAGFLLGLSWETVIAMASRFAAAVCTVRGALPESDDFYAPFMEELERERNG
jgi:fructokinase